MPVTYVGCLGSQWPPGSVGEGSISVYYCASGSQIYTQTGGGTDGLAGEAQGPIFTPMTRARRVNQCLLK